MRQSKRIRSLRLATGETVEAGIDARGPATSWNLPVELSFEEEIDLGIAFLNLSDETTPIGLSLYAEGERFDSTEVVLAPKARTDLFVTELLLNTQNQNIEGTVVISAERDVIVTSLRTRRGVAESSVALGTQQVFENPR